MSAAFDTLQEYIKPPAAAVDPELVDLRADLVRFGRALNELIDQVGSLANLMGIARDLVFEMPRGSDPDCNHQLDRLHSLLRITADHATRLADETWPATA